MPTVTVRPNATLSIGADDTPTPSGTAHGVLSDDSDSTYLNQTMPSMTKSVTSVSLPAPSLPAGAAWKTRTIRVRAQKTGVGTVIAAVILDDGQQWTSAGGLLTTSVAEYSSSPAPMTVSAAMVASLGNSAASPGTTAQVMELYVDADYATQPTVAVSAPTGTFSDRSAVDVAWTYTAGTDGGSQSRYQVRVFSAAQYGVGGFNPATSAASWDSGTVLGFATTATTGVLGNATYRAYVRAAQTINGQPHWSEWDYEQFEIDVDTPDILSFTATGQDDNARVRLVVTEDDTSDVLWDTLDVERSDDGGITWVFVRGATAATPPGHMWIGYDYEAPNGTTVVYRARGSAVVDGFQVVGGWGQSNSTSWTSNDAWLKDPHDTSRSQIVHVTRQTALLHDRPQGVFLPLGSSTPIVIADERQRAIGDLTLRTDTDDECAAVLAILSGTPALLLQMPASWGFGSRWVAPNTVSVSRLSSQARAETSDRMIDVGFTEVARPVDDGEPIALGVDWADILESGLTWQDALDQGLTWADLI